MGVASVSASEDINNSVEASDESAQSVNITLADNGDDKFTTTLDNSLGVENEESYGSSESEDTLTVADGTFTDLYNKVKNGGTVTLDRNYVYTASTDSAYVSGVTIDKTTTINGNGFTLNGNNVARIFQITASNVVLNNINFINGKSSSNGGAILWTGENAILKNSTFKNNQIIYSDTAYGAAVHITSQKAKITYCNFIDNNYYTTQSGGVLSLYYSHYSIVDNCVFKNNHNTGWDTSADGGALHIYSSNNVNTTNCLFDNNSASDDGGAIILNTASYNRIINCKFYNNYNKNNGGAVSVWRGAYAYISDCEFINNSAVLNGGGLFVYLYDTQGVSIYNCKFINNSATTGGGIQWAGQNGHLENCLFDDNFATTGSAINWDGTGGSVSGAEFVDYTGNEISSGSSGLVVSDTKYGPLYISPTGTGNGLSRNAPTNWANAISKIAETSTIYFLPGTYTNIVNQTISKSVSLESLGNVIIDAGKKGRVFTITANDVKISGITFINGFIRNGHGGAITWTGSNGEITQSTFRNNIINYTNSHGYGSSLYATGTNMKITYCNFTDTNYYTTQYGGVLSTFGSSTLVDHCLFKNNHNLGVGTSADGGAVSFWSSNSVVSNCIFINNSASNDGGALIVISVNNVNVTNCVFYNNFQPKSGIESRGGALCIWDARNVNVVDCYFKNNTAGVYGGAIYSEISSSNTNITGCTFVNNGAGSSGGAIFNTGSNFIISDSTFDGNYAPSNNDVRSTTTIILNNLTYNSKLTVNVNDIIVGESLTIAGTLSDVKSGAVIDIKDNNVKIGTVTVNNNQFTHAHTFTTVGNHVISLGTTDDSGNTYVYNTNSFSFRAVPVDSYTALQMLINRASTSTLNLARNYNYYSAYDTAFVGGVKVNQTLVINGGGFSIDGKNTARAFDVIANGVTIQNAKLINGKSTGNGGAVYWSGSNGLLNTITFTNNNANNYKHVYTTQSNLRITGSKFPDTTVTLTANPTSIMYGNNIALSGTVNDGTNVAKSLSILSGSTTVATVSVSVSGTFSTTWIKPAAGNYTLTLATTDANSNTYTFTQPTVKVEVKQYTTDLTITVTGSKVQENVKISVDTNREDATGTVDILFNSRTTPVTLIGGKGELTVGKLAANTYDITATYQGDAKYQKTIAAKTFTITKYDTATSLTLTNVNVGNAVPVVATVTSNGCPIPVNGRIILVGLGTNRTININNGQGTLDVTDLPAGRYVVTMENFENKEVL